LSVSIQDPLMAQSGLPRCRASTAAIDADQLELAVKASCLLDQLGV
jgi:hypothetical protein